MTEIGCKTSIKKDETPIVKNSTIKVPKQSAIKEAPQQPSLRGHPQIENSILDVDPTLGGGGGIMV